MTPRDLKKQNNFVGEPMPNKPFTATGVWLRRIGDQVHLLVEIDGRWRLAVTEHFDGPFSHIAEGNGAKGWPLDPVTGKP